MSPLRLSAALLLASSLFGLGCGTPPAQEVDDEISFDETPEADETALKADAASGGVELKFTLRPDQVSSALSKFKLTAAKATRRDVWFYDTGGLALFDAGLVLRARKTKGGADDSTVKLRPLLAGDVDRSWFGVSGFKCEEDRVGTRAISSCSLTNKQDTGEIDSVGRGTRTVEKLFTADQEEFVDGYHGALDWTSLEALGPVDAKVWRFYVKGFKPQVTAEQWTLPDGSNLLELSTKVTLREADQIAKAFEALLVARKFDTSAKQETKTRTALEFFSGR